MNWEAAAGLGALGAVLPDLIKALRKRFEKKPEYISTGWYWGNVAVLAVVGAAVTVLLGPREPVEAIAYGAAALTILTQLLAVNEEKHLGAETRERIGTFQRMRRWWGS